MKYGELTLGQVEAIINKLGGHEAAMKFLRGEPAVPGSKYREEDGVIYFSVTPNGTTGEDWIERLENEVGSYAKQVLRSPDFKPTNGVTTEVAVLKGMLFSNDDRTTEKIRLEAKKRGFQTPNAEIAGLIREKFSNQEIKAMGLWWIVAMHNPIEDSNSVPHLLLASREYVGRWLDACDDGPGRRWNRGDGFAFAVPQVSS